VLITGDISESRLLEPHLLILEKELAPKPVFFVLGNHDYWHASSMEAVRDVLRDRHTYPDYEKGAPPPMPSGAFWLGSSGHIPLTDKTALVGHDGWWDGIYGSIPNSKVWLNDYSLNRDLAREFQGGLNTMIRQLQILSKEGADYVKLHVEAAFAAGFETVYVATHVPPFPENSVYNGRQSDKDWMPHFSSYYMGDMLLNLADAFPKNNVVLLCGHSHGETIHRPRANLVCHTGPAIYGSPGIAGIFDADVFIR